MPRRRSSRPRRPHRLWALLFSLAATLLQGLGQWLRRALSGRAAPPAADRLDADGLRRHLLSAWRGRTYPVADGAWSPAAENPRTREPNLRIERRDGHRGPEVLAIDLHGLRVRDGEDLVERLLTDLSGLHRRPGVRLITGRGAHNPDGRSPLREAIGEQLAARRVPHDAWVGGYDLPARE